LSEIVSVARSTRSPSIYHKDLLPVVYVTADMAGPTDSPLYGQFTATSMIGMIALAGIIVRNSILLVDFINQQVREGRPFEDAVINSAAVRAKPIALTALAAMAGAIFILDDPIFSGLAVSLLFGLFISTVLTLIVIPVVYYGVMRKRVEWIRAATGWLSPASGTRALVVSQNQPAPGGADVPRVGAAS
jgi:hypothetical protein